MWFLCYLLEVAYIMYILIFLCQFFFLENSSSTYPILWLHVGSKCSSCLFEQICNGYKACVIMGARWVKIVCRPLWGNFGTYPQTQLTSVSQQASGSSFVKRSAASMLSGKRPVQAAVSVFYPDLTNELFGLVFLIVIFYLFFLFPELDLIFFSLSLFSGSLLARKELQQKLRPTKRQMEVDHWNLQKLLSQKMLR